MNFSKINYRSFFGRIIRLPLRLIPKDAVMPILQGRLKGKKWVVGAGEHGYWLGSYEYRKRKMFEKFVYPGAVIYDIGANVGYFSLLAAELAGKKGTIYAIEPLPRNIEFIQRHISLNKINNIQVIEAAVSDQIGEAYFDLGASTAMGHLAKTGKLAVKSVTLDGLLEEGKILPPGIIKLDVEGAEYLALSGAQKLVERYQPIIFMDTHQREAHHASIRFLQGRGYEFTILDGKPLDMTKELIAVPKNRSQRAGQ
jgi:FkbM family methyltransferase